MFNKKPIKQSVFANGADKNGTRYGASGDWKSTFDPSKIGNLEKYKVREGKNLIDIVPFNASDKHPMVVSGGIELGDTVYSLDYYIHRSIGGAQKDFVCLAQYGKRCPICGESKRYYQKGTEADKKQGGLLRAKRRVIYLVHDLIDGKYYYWDTGWMAFEKPINARAQITIDERTGAPVNPFDWETGKSISFYGVKDKFNGHDYVKIQDGTFDFVSRAPLSDEVLEHSVDLSQGVVMCTEEDMDAALCGKPVVSNEPAKQAEQKPVEQKPVEPKPAEPDPAPASPAVASLAEQASEPAPAATAAPVEKKCPFGFEWGSADKHPECTRCGNLWESCILK